MDADDKESLNKQQKVLKWDRKRKKYIHIDPNIDIYHPKKKLKDESGHIIQSSSKSGKLYKEWKQKTKIQIPKIGEKENLNILEKTKKKLTHFPKLKKKKKF